jgi:hypothetical protein
VYEALRGRMGGYLKRSSEDRFPSPQNIHWLWDFLFFTNIFYHDVVATELTTEKGIPRIFPNRCLLKGACPRQVFNDILSGHSSLLFS